MDRDSSLGSLIFGLAVGYFIWGNEPAYIDNLKASVSDEAHGGAWVLAKTTFGVYDQIAVVHGLIDDAAGCETFRTAMEHEGGDWVCVPTSAITGGKPWWEFWQAVRRQSTIGPRTYKLTALYRRCLSKPPAPVQRQIARTYGFPSSGQAIKLSSRTQLSTAATAIRAKPAASCSLELLGRLAALLAAAKNETTDTRQ